MKNIKHLNLNNLSFIFILTYLSLKSIMGLTIFSLRLGEILMGFSAVILIVLFVWDLLRFKNLDQFQKNIV